MYSWTSISTGSTHSLAARSDGVLFAWGRNNFGQLGLGDTITRSSPVQLGTSSWTQVSAGAEYSIGVDVLGKLYVWGFNTGGQLGDGTIISKSSPVQIGVTESWTNISAGLSHASAVTNTFKLFTWGNNSFSQLGDATTISRSSPIQIASNISWNFVNTGGSHTTALTTDSKLYTWGRNDFGQLGSGITNSWVPGNPRSTGGNSVDALTIIDTNGNLFALGQMNLIYGNNVTGTVGNASSPVQIGIGRSYRYVARAGAPATIFAIDGDYKLWSWGNNTVGNLADGTTITKSSPVQIGNSSWSMITTAFQNIFAIDVNGRLFSWGSGNNGVPGQNTININYSSPVQVGTSSWNTVSSGLSAAYAIRSDGTMWGWGGAAFVGDGTTVAKSSPVQLGVGFSWSTVCATSTSALAIRSDGLLFGWGQNIGVLGLNDTIFRSSPTQIGSDSWTSITTGASHVIALKSNGIYFAWGLNTSGQLGNNRGGPGNAFSSPVQVGYSYPTIIADNLSTMGFASDNTLYLWGANNLGQLGLNDAVYRSNPTQITNIKAQISPMQVGTSNWVDVSAGTSHSLAITSDGKLFAWGANNNGQIGIVGSYKTVTQGINHKYLLNSDNMLFSAGYNQEGQLGINSNNSNVNAVAVSTTTQFSSVFIGSNAGYGVDFNKNLWAWGYGAIGALGNNTIVSASSPALLGGSWNNIAVTQWADNVMNYPVAYGITTDNKLFSWGQNFSGLRLAGNFLGTTNASSPVQIGSDTNWDALAPNRGTSLFMIAKKTDGSIYGWGQNQYGQLGFANTTLVSWIQLAGSNQHTLGLKSDGTVWGWGDNTYGQLGVADIIARNSPVQLDTTNSYIQVAAGGYNLPMSLFIRTNKTLWATGYNVNGTLADNSTINRSSPVQVPGSWNSVGVGYSGHVAAVASDNTLWGWGNNFYYAVGDGTSIYRSSPVQISTSSFTMVSAGGSNWTLAQSTDGALWGWGYNTFYPLGTTYMSWSVISTGQYHTIGIKSNGTAWAWGSGGASAIGGAGQLGLGDTLYRSSPVQIGTGNSYLSAIAGLRSSYLIDNQYRLFGFGNNSGGALGDSTTIDRSSPVQIGGSWTNIINTGSFFTYGYKTDGTLWVWGQNQNGMFGNNTIVSTSSPIQMATNYVKVAAGVSTAFGIDSLGKLYSWGWNSNGATGDNTGIGSTAYRSSPVQIGSSSFTAVGAFQTGGAAIDINQNLWAWGSNNYGQLGLGDTVTRSNPTQITGSWSEIYPSMESFIIAKKTDNTVWAWGMNLYGQHGTGNNISRSSPVQIGVGLSKIGTGLRFATYTLNDYTYMFGDNSYGQTASPGTTPATVNTPTSLGGLDNYYSNLYRQAAVILETPTKITSSSYSMISTGDLHVTALTNDGKLFTWGWNNAGQLGTGPSPYSLLAGTLNTFVIRQDGKLFSAGGSTNYVLLNNSTAASATFVSPTLEVAAQGLSWRKLSASMGDNFVTGIKQDGTLWAWGLNTWGQIGDNTITLKSSLTMVVGQRWSDVAQGASHTIAIRSDGTLWSWGYNNLGQLGDSTTTNRSSPVQVGTNSYIQISSLNLTTYGIQSNNTLWAWGNNANGQLGDNTTINKSNPVQIPGSWSLISSGLSHVVAQQTNGTVWSWGANPSGIGDGTSYARSSPVQVQTTTSFTKLSAGNSFTVGLTSNNELYMWGDNSQGQATTTGSSYFYSDAASHIFAGYFVRDGVLYGTSLQTSRLWPFTGSTTSPIMLAGNIKQHRAFYSTGSGSAVLTFITNDGKLWSSQNNNYGQVGDGTTIFRSSPTQIGTDTNWAKLGDTMSSDVNSFIKTDGTLYVSGYNAGGQLGDGTTINRSSPVQVPGSWNIVSAGMNSTYAIDSNNKLWSWGYNTAGALGQVTSGISWTIYGTNMLDKTYFAIDEVGSLWAWGTNTYGGLGDGTVIDRNSAVQIGTSSWSVIGAAGTYVTAGITVDGKLFTWGYNNVGQLGSTTTVNRSSPVQVGTSSWAFVTAGLSVVAAIDINRRLFVWGENSSGQLGQNDLVKRSSPVQVAGSWSTVSVMGPAIAAIQMDGTLWTWGTNATGELGNGTTTSKSNPVQIGSATNWTKIFTGNDQSQSTGQMFAINSSGQLFAWGSNFFGGQLGDGTTISKSSPVQIDGSWNTIATAFAGTLGIKSDSTLFGWGTNNTPYRTSVSGTTRSSPVQISAGTRVSFTQVITNASNTVFVTPDQQIYAIGQDSAKMLTPMVGMSSPVQVAALGGKPLSNTIHRSSPVQLGGQDWLDVKAGASFAVALRADNTVWTWGANESGQLGTKDIINRSSPVQVYANTLSWNLIAASSNTAAAIDITQKLWTWGYAPGGYLGDNTVVSKSSPVQVGTSSWTMIQGSLPNFFAIRSDNTLWGWGTNGYYNLGDGGADRSNPTQIGTKFDSINIPVPKVIRSSPYVNVAAGASHIVAARLDGTLDVWGGNSSGQLGDGSSTARSSPVQVLATTGYGSGSPRQVAGSWLSVNAGFSTSSALDAATSTVFAWGYNNVGQLGDGTIVSKSSPVLIGTPTTYSVYYDGSDYLRTTAISQSAITTFTMEAWVYLLGSTGSYICSTYNTLANQGWGFIVDATAGIKYGATWHGASNFATFATTFSSGIWYHVAVVRSGSNLTAYKNGVSLGTQTFNGTWPEGTTLAIGYSNSSNFPSYLYGHISNFRIVQGYALYTSNFTVPTTPLTAVTGTVLLTCQSSTLIDNSTNNYPITTVGTPYASTFNPLGITGTMDKLYNSEIPSTNFASKSNQLYGTGLGAGYYALQGTTNTSAFTAVGTVYNSTYYSPVLIDSGSWNMIATSQSHTAAIKGDGSLWSWGYNLYGQLGDNSTISRSSPVQIGTSSYSMVVAGYINTWALTTDGKLFAWGATSFGAQGMVPAINRSSPVQISIGKSFTFIDGAGYVMNAIDTDNKLYTWGYNNYGQLGIGSLTNQFIPYQLVGAPTLVNKSSPVQVTGSTSVSWTQVSAGNNFSGAIDTAGILYMWGQNNTGQLGAGSRAGPDRSSPVQLGSKSYSLVTAGYSQTMAYSNIDTTLSPKSLYVWGSNSYGQLGTNDTIARNFAQPALTTQLYNRASSPVIGPATLPIGVSSPTQVGASSWTTVSSGDYHTIGTTTGNVLFTWGLNNNGQLGDSTLINKSSPVQITTDIIDVSAGGSHNVIEKSDGSAYTFGLNSDGQLGDNT